MKKSSSMKILLPEKKMRSNSVKIKNLRVSKTGRISISNYNSNIIKEKIRQIRQSMVSYNISNLMKSNELITNTKKYINKKSLILSLKEDLDYHQKIFDSYQAYEQYAGGICKAYKKNYEDIFIYKNDLAEDLKDFIQMLTEYENGQKDLAKEKRLIKQSNEDIIKYKLEEQINLNKKILKLNEDLEKQKVTLTELNAILKCNLNTNENNLINLQNEELKYKDKLEMMESAYKKLVYKYNYYQDLTNLEQKKKFLNVNTSNSEETNEASIKLKEETLKNNYLKKEINIIKNKMKDLNNFNTSKSRKFRMSFNNNNKDTNNNIDSKTTYSKFSETKINFTSNMINQ